MRTRILIEGEAIALAAPRMTLDDYRELHGDMAELEALRLDGDPATWIRKRHESGVSF